MDVRFLRGLAAKYATIEKDDKTFYYVTDENKLYLGSVLLSNQVVEAEVDALEVRVKALEDADFQGQIDTINTWKNGLPAYVTEEVYNAHLTTQDTRDDGQDALITGLRNDLDQITEIGGEPNKVDDVKVDGVSVVTDKVANINLTDRFAAKLDVATYNTDKATIEGNITTAQNRADAAYELADAAQTATEVGTAIDNKIAALDLANTYEVKGAAATAEQNAKNYAKDLVDAIPAQTDYTVTITENTDDATVAKTYVFTQNGAEIGAIKLAKELVVTSGSVKEVTVADAPYAGAVVGDKYIELVIANQDTPIYVPAKDLVDIYTAKDGATEVQVAISNTNEISATLVNGGVTEEKLAEGVKTKLNKTWEEVGVAEGLVDALEADIKGKPAYNITATQVTNWDDEVGAKALAETKTTTAEVKDQIEAYGYATEADLTLAENRVKAIEDSAAYNSGITAEKVGNYDTAYGWGNHAEEGYLKAADIEGKADTADLKALAYKDVAEKTDLAADVQASLDKADTALQAHQDISHLATKTEAQGYANAKDEAIAAAKKAGDDAQADVDALEGVVGAGFEGKTVTAVITENAQTCQTNFNTISTQLTWGEF